MWRLIFIISNKNQCLQGDRKGRGATIIALLRIQTMVKILKIQDVQLEYF